MRTPNTRPPVVIAIVVFFLLATAHAVLGWQEKVDSAVLESAASGQQTEFLIYLDEKADLSAAQNLPTKEEKGAYVYDRLRAVAATSQAPLIAQLELLGAEHRSFWIANAVWARGDLTLIETVASRPDVAHVYPVGGGSLDPPVGTAATGGSSLVLAVEENLTQVGADQVWAMGIRGQGVTVAGADTGVEWTHSALREQYRGWDGVNADHNYNWRLGASPNSSCPQFPSTEPCDDDDLLGGGHGTHTMGTMVGDDGGANQVGMAPDARWIACRNMNFGVGTVPSYLDCMEWFIAPTDLAGNNPDPSRAPHVVNNSWACAEGCPAPLLKDTLASSVAAGIFYAVSAGNFGPDCSSIHFPLAIYEDAFTVGATDHRTDAIAGFSSRGPVILDVPDPARSGPDISAPGVGIRSAVKGGGYGSLSGTSMAGPHVAGLAALIISANPALAGDVETIAGIIEQTAVRLTTDQGCGDDTPQSVPNNSFGHGRIDALAAVLAAIELGDRCGDDDDDFDSDGKRDDVDSDDDGDGKKDDEDSDDDSDGESDDSDSDDDNDCIPDEFDSRSTREHQSRSSGRLAPGESADVVLTSSAGDLLLVALAEGVGAEGLAIEIRDPAGAALALSVAAPGRSLASVVPALAGEHVVRVRNDGAQPVAYRLTLVRRDAWP